jgi:DNA-directed RNA polymerase specialized sigma24 family protein
MSDYVDGELALDGRARMERHTRECPACERLLAGSRAAELERQLEAALDELPADWRAAVVLRDIEGLSTHEAAEVVGAGEAAFKIRLHRGRMQLRALLESYLDLESRLG